MTMDGMVETVDRAAEVGRQAFYDRARVENLAPLWRVLHGLVTETPAPTAVAAHYDYERIRPYLMEACSIIGVEESQRRVLVLENPALLGQSRITNSLFAGLQVILPGEVAPAHRHVASALRFVIEGRDAYTSVGGERTRMQPGDFVITPSMAWHDHGNESDLPMVWLDGLDMHLVNILGASFREEYPSDLAPPVTRPEGSALGEFGLNLLPDGLKHASQTSPIFNYRYARTRESLEWTSRSRKPDPCHGYRMNYVNPLTGGWPIPTMSTSIRLLPKGFVTQRYLCTAGTVFVVVEGSGTARLGPRSFPFKAKDLFVAPSWQSTVIEAHDDVVLFSYSDQAVQEKLDLFREVRGDA